MKTPVRPFVSFPDGKSCTRPVESRIANPVVPALALALLMVAAPLRSDGLTINPVYDGSITNLPTSSLIQGAFANAIQYFQNTYSDPITINLNVYFGNQGPFTGTPPITGGAASFGNNLVGYTYNSVVNMLTADRKSPDDYTAVNSLPGSNPLPLGSFMLTTAQAKALGQAVNYGNSYFGTNFGAQFAPYGATNGVDGWVAFAPNTNLWYFGGGTIPTNQEDFVGDAEHEISEVLGRITNLKATNFIPFGMAFDMFRYKAVNALSFTTNDNNVWFSINKGTNLLAQFNAALDGDLHDWSSSTPASDPYSAFGQDGVANSITAVDTQTLDVIGYDLVPEPGSLTFLAAGLGLLALRYHTRRPPDRR